MTDNNHPITPPEEIIDKWESEWHHHQGKDTYEVFMAKQAARWGADQELEACVSYVDNNFSGNKARALRAVRRPKPPSLKEQAMQAMDRVDVIWATDEFGKETLDDINAIRRALESLPD